MTGTSREKVTLQVGLGGRVSVGGSSNPQTFILSISEL